jgi:hypothetical protein
MFSWTKGWSASIITMSASEDKGRVAEGTAPGLHSCVRSCKKPRRLWPGCVAVLALQFQPSSPVTTRTLASMHQFERFIFDYTLAAAIKMWKKGFEILLFLLSIIA